MRGDVKYSGDCRDGEARGCAVVVEGSGDARFVFEALRLWWPGRRYENMFEGAMCADWGEGRRWTVHADIGPGGRRRPRKSYSRLSARP